jgi:MFS family permease
VKLFQWNRDFGVFLCTQGISNIGDAARNVLIPLYVLQLTHNPLQVSLVAVLETVAFAGLRIPFGAISDRHEGRRLMVIADIARMLLTLAIPLTALSGGPTLVTIYVVIVPIAAGSALFESAAGAVVPMLVSEDRRGMAYAWRESFESLAWVIGPPIGGVVAAVAGTGQALGLDSATFLVSVIGLAALTRRFEAKPAAGEHFLASMTAGFRLMFTDRVLRRDEIIWGTYSLLGGSIVLGLVYAGSRGGKSDAFLATLAVAAYAAGSTGGTMIAGTLDKISNFWPVIAGGLAIAAAGAALIAGSGTPFVIVGGALFGLGEGLVLVFHLTLRAKSTPEGYFGRVTGVAQVINQVAAGLSIVWLGIVLKFAPGHTAFIILAAAVLVLAAWVAIAPRPVSSGPAVPSAPSEAPAKMEEPIK